MKHLFFGGLHRSGTWACTHCLNGHPDISALSDSTGKAIEGQFLQNVFPKDSIFGGPGRFGFSSDAHFVEASPWATDVAIEQLRQQWIDHWDTSKPVLLDKTPANLIRARFFQKAYPDARFIFMMRHPVAVALATQKWSRTSVTSLIEHWLVCHELMEQDCSKLKSYRIIKYEDFVKQPQDVLDQLYEFVGLPSAPMEVDVNPAGNNRYFESWDSARLNANKKPPYARVITKLSPYLLKYGYVVTSLNQEIPDAIDRYEERVRKFGYSLDDLLYLSTYTGCCAT